MTIKFMYLDGKYHNPPMSKKLKNQLIELAANLFKSNVQTVTFVDAGTVGDARHRRDNPKSYHLHTPPDAIDIEKIYYKYTFSDTTECLNLKSNAPGWRENRKRVANRWKSQDAGNKAYHANDASKQHIHLQVKS